MHGSGATCFGEVRALSALVRVLEVPVHEFPLQRVPLPVLFLSTTHVLELELIQTQMAQKPMLRAEVGMRVRCANKASAE
jgi:hypothetical protein